MGHCLGHWRCVLLVTISILIRSGVTYDAINNQTEAPSYEEFNNNYRAALERIYAGYPEKDNLTGLYPNPKGSRIIRHPNEALSDHWTIETDVEIFVTVEGIAKMDVDNQCLGAVVEVTYFWKDEHFKLADQGYTYSDMVEIDKKKIWTPLIYADGVYKEEVLTSSPTVRIQLEEGVCFMTAQKLYEIPCRVNVQPFPRDIHDCSLRLSQRQRSNTRMHLILVNTPKLLEKYKNDTLSLITSKSAKESLSSDSGSLDWIIRDFNESIVIRERSNNDPFESESYILKLHINRRSLFYTVVLIFPCILLNLLSFVIFTLPLKDTERENFAVTLILTYFVLIMIIVDNSPSSGNDIPLLGLYIFLSMCIVLVDFVISLALIEIHEHCRERDRKMPDWLSNCLDASCILKLFTSKRHFLHDDNGNDASADEVNDTDDMLKKRRKKNGKRSISGTKNEYKWKVFSKVLNFIFFLISVIAHLILLIVTSYYFFMPYETI